MATITGEHKVVHTKPSLTARWLGSETRAKIWREEKARRKKVQLRRNILHPPEAQEEFFDQRLYRVEQQTRNNACGLAEHISETRETFYLVKQALDDFSGG